MSYKKSTPPISFYIEDVEGGVVIFGYDYSDFFHMIDDVENKLASVAPFCKRTNKIVTHKYYYRDINQWELQIIVEKNG